MDLGQQIIRCRRIASMMTDEEIRALWLYLQTVPAKPYGNR